MFSIKPIFAVTGVLSLSLLFTSFMWYNTSNKLDKEKSAHFKTVAEFTIKQAQAEAMALETKIQLEEKYEKSRKESDAAYQSLSDKYRAAVLRYQKANTIRLPSAAGTSEDPSGSSIPDGPGGDTLVSVKSDDLMICAINTARLVNAREWAISTLDK